MTTSSTRPRAAKSMPTPGTTCWLSITPATVALPAARAAAAACSGVMPGGQLLADDPREDHVGGPAEDDRPDHVQRHRDHAEHEHGDHAEALGPQQADQPLARRGRSPSPSRPAARPRAHGGRPRGAGRPSRARPRQCRRPAPRIVEARSVRSCDRLLRRVLGLDDLDVGRAGRSSSACVPLPTITPSSSTTIWSASAMVDTRWATITTVASAVTGFSAARSRASVARSSAENESSNR